MENQTPAPTESVTCNWCHGSGEAWTGEREPDTGAMVTLLCSWCDGTGEVTYIDHIANTEV